MNWSYFHWKIDDLLMIFPTKPQERWFENPPWLILCVMAIFGIYKMLLPDPMLQKLGSKLKKTRILSVQSWLKGDAFAALINSTWNNCKSCTWRHSYHFWHARCLGPQRVDISRRFFLGMGVEPNDFGILGLSKVWSRDCWCWHQNLPRCGWALTLSRTYLWNMWIGAIFA